MRLLTFLFAFVFQTIIFAQTFSPEDSIQKKQESERVQMFKERLKQYNELCSKDSIRAVNDSKIQNKFYIFNTVPSGNDFPAKNELRDILKNNNILWGGIGTGSDIPLHYTTDKCYSSYMTFFTEKKFGKEFIDNLVKQSLLNHIEKNPSIIFEYNDHLDWIYEGEYSLADKLLNKHFFTKFKYPKNYKYSSVENQNFTEVELEVDENSYIVKLVGFKHHLSKNKEFIPYFEKSIRQFIESSNFIISERDYNYHGAKKSFKIYYK